MQAASHADMRAGPVSRLTDRNTARARNSARARGERAYRFNLASACELFPARRLTVKVRRSRRAGKSLRAEIRARQTGIPKRARNGVCVRQSRLRSFKVKPV